MTSLSSRIPDSDRRRDADCPHMSTCEMYPLMSFAGTLETWKIRYCKADFQLCARYRASSEGRPVPVNLMPSGALLNKKPR